MNEKIEITLFRSWQLLTYIALQYPKDYAKYEDEWKELENVSL